MSLQSLVPLCCLILIVVDGSPDVAHRCFDPSNILFLLVCVMMLVMWEWQVLMCSGIIVSIQPRLFDVLCPPPEDEMWLEDYNWTLARVRNSSLTSKMHHTQKATFVCSHETAEVGVSSSWRSSEARASRNETCDLIWGIAISALRWAQEMMIQSIRHSKHLQIRSLSDRFSSK
jgi:hypothetical protein